MSGHHVVPFKTNLITFLTLVVLTVVTVYTAKYVDLGEFNLALAMAIAGVKATVVGLWFMHLKYDTWMNRAIMLSAIVFVALLFVISAVDMFTRA
ncbi:MAG: cytochrome C oxidase subunit IV family protein [Bacteriovoracaceae bacterium]|nr:cytochrome C oxidase subunit IV family protein [Bacteriovoracaceae bacterium]